MSADWSVATTLARLLQKSAAPFEIERLLRRVRPALRDRVVHDAWRLAGLSAAHAPGNEYEGATEAQVGDRIGPGAGYDQEPPQILQHPGIAES